MPPSPSTRRANTRDAVAAIDTPLVRTNHTYNTCHAVPGALPEEGPVGQETRVRSSRCFFFTGQARVTHSAARTACMDPIESQESWPCFGPPAVNSPVLPFALPTLLLALPATFHGSSPHGPAPDIGREAAGVGGALCVTRRCRCRYTAIKSIVPCLPLWDTWGKWHRAPTASVGRACISLLPWGKTTHSQVFGKYL